MLVNHIILLVLLSKSTTKQQNTTCNGWSQNALTNDMFTHMWKIIAKPHHSTHVFNPTTFYWSAGTKTGKWAVVLLLCLGISILPLYMICRLDLELSRQGCIFVFHLIWIIIPVIVVSVLALNSYGYWCLTQLFNNKIKQSLLPFLTLFHNG
jgi:hypothetical protein